LAVKSLAKANCCAGAGSSLLIAAHVSLVTKVIGMADAEGAVSKGEFMRVSRIEAGRTTELAGYPGDFNGEAAKLFVKSCQGPKGRPRQSGYRRPPN
jgi:hypothetical protein